MLFCGLFFVRLIIAVQTQFLLAKTKKKNKYENMLSKQSRIFLLLRHSTEYDKREEHLHDDNDDDIE